MTRCVAGMLLLVGGADAVRAQEYAFRRYGAEAGVRGPQAVAFDGQGSLLVGTNDGVARFDGRSFIDVRLPWRSAAWRLETAADGAVWALSTRPGLLRIAPGREAQSVPIPAPLEQRLRERVWPIRLRVDGQGHPWLSGGDGTLYRWNGPVRRTWTSVSPPGVSGIGDFFVRGDMDSCEIVFASGDRVGVVSFERGRLGRARWIASPGGGLFYLRPHPRALAWAGGERGVFLVAADGTARQVSPAGERAWPHHQAAVDPDGRLLTLAEGRTIHVLRFDPGGRMEFDAGAERGLNGVLPVSFAFDPEGGFWLADQRSLLSLEDERSRRYVLPDAAGEIVQIMSGDAAAGAFVVGTYQSVYRLVGSRFERVARPESGFVLPFGLSATPVPQWVQWTSEGTSGRTTAGSLPRVVLHSAPGVRYEVNAVGLWSVRHGRRVLVTPGIKPGATGSTDTEGRVWIGGEVARMDVVVGDSLGSVCSRCLPASLRAALEGVNANLSAGVVLADRLGHVWVQGATGGLGVIWPTGRGRWRWRVFHSSDGVLGNVVTISISPDGRRLWLGTTNGLQGLPLVAGPPRLRSFVEIDSRDGLASDRVSAISEDSRGYLWVSTQAGFVDRLEWRALERRAGSPNVRVERVEVSGKPTPFGSRPIRVRSGDGLTLSLAARTYRQPLRVRLEYRLQGRDTSWSSLGTARSLALAALPAGRRALEIRAVREGRAPGRPIAIALDVRPPFYRSAWFGVLLVCSAGLSWWSARRVRAGRRRAADAVRQRIAEDLHDEVGSGLAQVALYSELIRRLADPSSVEEHASSPSPDVAELATRVGGQVEALSGSMRDLVWAIRPEERSWEELELRLKDAVVAHVAPRGIEADFRGRVDSAQPTLSAEVCQNVLLFAKEAVHNAVRHGNARRVEVRWRVRKRSLHLEVQDDGVGFDPATARRGMGLVSMRRRAESLGGTHTIVSSPGRGTAASLDVPLW